jgi:hypothetical protein
MAFGSSTFTNLSGAVGDLFAAEGHKIKAEGNRVEAENYDLASQFSLQNVEFTKTSTAIKTSQTERENTKMLGGVSADVAGAGFAASGSALDILHESAAQGALTKSVGEFQGLITEAGYEQQAKSYQNMAKAARMAADAEDTAALGATITGGIKGIASIATLFTS